MRATPTQRAAGQQHADIGRQRWVGGADIDDLVGVGGDDAQSGAATFGEAGDFMRLLDSAAAISSTSSGCTNAFGTGGPQAYSDLSGAQSRASHCGIFGDLIEVGVVLGEVAGRVAEVPEQVAAEEVAAEPPDIAARVDGEQVLRALADLVDIVDLPRRMVEERNGRIDEPDIVMVGAAAEEGDHAGAGVAELEAEHVGEEAHAGLEIGGRVQHMAELARAVPSLR